MAQRGLGMWSRAVAAVIKPTMTVWTSRTWTGQEHIPRSGGVIIAANHVSHFDPMVCAHYVYEADRWPQFLAKASLFKVPLVGSVLRKVHQVPVERGRVRAGRGVVRPGRRGQGVRQVRCGVPLQREERSPAGGSPVAGERGGEREGRNAVGAEGLVDRGGGGDGRRERDGREVRVG